jgi:hypothetical protein
MRSGCIQLLATVHHYSSVTDFTRFLGRSRSKPFFTVLARHTSSDQPTRTRHPL